MKSKRRLLPLLAALLILGSLSPASGASSESSSSESSSTESPKIPTITSYPKLNKVVIHEVGSRPKTVGESRDGIRGRDPPGSPVNLFMPDEFQFYTLNNDGQLVMKQMSKQEIQGMIAAGGGGMPVDLGPHQTHLPHDGEAKVSDVVQNVQKVLKSELNKPVQMLHTTSIPGSVNSEWTNLLPMILSGGSVDNQESSVLMPTLEADQSYVDVIPIGKPVAAQYEPETNYVQLQPTTAKQEIKLVTLKPNTAEKPIHLLGNMALPSGILGEQQTYTLPAPSSKPNIHATHLHSQFTTTSSKPNIHATHLHSQFTTTKPSLISILKETDSNSKNSSAYGKPTLYIPLSPTLLADKHNQDQYSSVVSGGSDIAVLPGHPQRPILFMHNATKLGESETSETPLLIPWKKQSTTSQINSDDSGFTRVPMIQVPIISADNIATTTHRINYQQTPTFEILSTISPGSVTGSSVKGESHPSKINLGPIGGFKKPSTGQRPSTLYRPVFESVTKPSSIDVTVPTASYPVYEAGNKQSTIGIVSHSTLHPMYQSESKLGTMGITSPTPLHPVYEATNKLSTVGLVPSSPIYPVYEAASKPSTMSSILPTYHPVYQPVTKISTVNFTSPTYRPVYQAEYKPSIINLESANAKLPTVDILTRPSVSIEGWKVTQQPGSMHYTHTTTGKASSTVLGVTKRPITQGSGVKVTQYPDESHLIHTTTVKVPTSTHKIVTTPSISSSGVKITKPHGHTHSTLTTGKISTTKIESVTKPSTSSSSYKVTKYPTKVTTVKYSYPVIETVTKPSTSNTKLEIIKHSTSVPVTTTKYEENDSPLVHVIHVPSNEKYPEIPLTSQNTENDSPLVHVIHVPSNEKYPEIPLTSQNTENDSPLVHVIHVPSNEKYPEIPLTSQNTESSDIDVPKYTVEDEPDTITESSKDSYSDDTDSNTVYYTTMPTKEIDGESPTTDYTTEKSSPEVPIQYEESSPESHYTYNQQNNLSKEPEMISKQTENTPFEVSTEVSEESSEESSENVSETKDQPETSSNLPIETSTALTEKSSETNKDAGNTLDTEKVTVQYPSTTKQSDEKYSVNDNESEQTPTFDPEVTTPIIHTIESTTESTSEIVEPEKSKDTQEEPAPSTYKETISEPAETNDDSSISPADENNKSTVKIPESPIMESDMNDSQQQVHESEELSKESGVPIYTTEKSNDKIITEKSTDDDQNINSDGKKSETKSPYEIIDSTTEYDLPEPQKDNNNNNLYENKEPVKSHEITEPVDTYETKITTENYDKPTIQYSTTTTETPITDIVDETLPTKKQDEPIMSSTEVNSDESDKSKISPEEDETSTVKVIPVYDDDTPMYTLPSNNQEKTTYPTISTIESSNTDKSGYTISTQEPYIISKLTNRPAINTITQTVKPGHHHYVSIHNHGNINIPSLNKHSSSSITVTPSMPSYTTPSMPTDDTVLPGLEETFNNYMKEHYDPSLSTTGNYDDISHLTTFPTITNKESINIIHKPSSGSTHWHQITTNLPTHEHQKPHINPDMTTIIYNRKPTETPTIQSTTSKYNSENKIETPIIHLDLMNTKKNNISHLHKDNHMSNSSLTRIKIKNPVMDIDKIISDAQSQVNTPSTVQYTLPSTSISPNNVASGLIAGYPTYSHGKPVTNYILGTKMPEMITETNRPSISEIPVQYNSDESKVNLPEENKDVSYQVSPTPSSQESDKINTGKMDSATSTYSIEDGESSTYDSTYSSDETPTMYESYTQIPFESLPIANKPEMPSQTEESNYQITSLDKINTLIHQLQNSHGQIGYADSDGGSTTIVPSETFKTIINHSDSSKDNTLTTILHDLSNTSTESQNATYVVLQTLPWTSTSKTYQVTTEPATTTEKHLSSTIGSTENNSDKNSSTGTTTLLTIIKQPVTGKPYVTSTYSTTKGFLDKIQSTIDKSAGRINLEEEKQKIPLKSTEATKYTTKQKYNYSTIRRPTSSYTRKPIKPITTITTTTIGTSSMNPGTNSKESNDKWTLIPQKGISEESTEDKKPLMGIKEETHQIGQQIVTLEHATGAIGLDQSNKGLDKDVAEFLNMCNELSFKFWTYANAGLNPSRSVTMSPFGMISTLAMIFLGARGTTSIQMNDILKLDDTVTFNPHLVFQNITDTVTLARGQGIENAAFVKALFADRLKVRRIMPFYKEQAQQFYEGAVIDINFSTAGDILRRRTNLLIRKQTGGRIKDFVKTYTVPLRSPLTALSANVFQTSSDDPDASSEGRDGEMYFAVSQTVKQRKLVPIPATVWKSNVAAGYEPSLDATAVALGDPKRPVSMIMVMPGQQGVTAPGDNLERLEYRLFGNPGDNALEKLLKVIIPRPIEVQMPKFSHRSIVNVTSALKKMGFDQLFSKTADLRGINGAGHDLYLADMLQMNLFSTCGDESKSGGRHLSETYPGTSSRHMRSGEINNNVNNWVYDFLDSNDKDESSSRSSISSSISSSSTESSSISSTSSSEGSSEESSEESSESSSSESSTSSLEKNSSKPTEKPERNKQNHLHKPKRLHWFMPNWHGHGHGHGHRRWRRQALPTVRPRMKIDKPFLYLIRHNLSGLILHIGRFNPKNQS